MKKKIIISLVAFLLLALAGLGGWLGWQRHYESTHVFVEDAVYDADARFLDLRGQGISAAHFEQLRRELPFCDILWDVPFQEGTYPSDTESIAVEKLTMENVKTLDYFTSLKAVDARSCRDYEALAALEQSRPELSVEYGILLSGTEYERDVTELAFAEADGEELLQNLAYLPQLKSVHFSDGALDAQSLLALRESYPEIAFTWEKSVLGTVYPDTVTELDFSGMELPPLSQLEGDMEYFPRLTQLRLCDTEVDYEEAAAFRDRVRDRFKVVWTVTMGKVTVDTDATTLMPYLFGYTGEPGSELKAEDCGPMKYLEDMVCMDLGHMEVKDISFVQYMPNLEYLLVADTGISDISPVAGLKKLKFLEIFYNHVTDVSALTQCPALEDVNICYNEVTDISPLLEMQNLNNLWMSGRFLSREQMDQLEQALPDTHMEFFVQGSVGKGWRKLPNYYAQRDMLGVWYLD